MLIGISGKIGSGKDTVGKIINYLTAKQNNPDISYLDYCEALDLNDKYLGKFEIKKFAGKLKQIVSILTGISVSDLEKQEVKDKILGKEWDKAPYMTGIPEQDENKILNPVTVRRMLQIVGTEAMRNVVHTNVWINALFADYLEELDIHHIKSNIGESTLKFPNWIITDVRFPNELEAIKARNGINIRVNRNNWIPKGGDTIQVKVFSNWSTITFTHFDESGNYCGIGPTGFKYSAKKAREYGQHFSETALDEATFDFVINNDGTIEELIENVREILISLKILK